MVLSLWLVCKKCTHRLSHCPLNGLPSTISNQKTAAEFSLVQLIDYWYVFLAPIIVMHFWLAWLSIKKWFPLTFAATKSKSQSNREEEAKRRRALWNFHFWVKYVHSVHLVWIYRVSVHFLTGSAENQWFILPSSCKVLLPWSRPPQSVGSCSVSSTFWEDSAIIMSCHSYSVRQEFHVLWS